MLKTLGFILLIAAVSVIFIPQARDFMECSLFGKGGKSEDKVIGPVSGFNPRVKEIQNALKGLGLYAGPADGTMNRDTRTALKKFQKKRSLKPTGVVDKATYAAINREKEPNKARARAAEDKTATESKTKIQDAIMGHRLKSKERTRQIQLALTKAGFYKGEADGKMGPQTKAAVKAFQKANGLIPDGVAGPKTFDALKGYLDR